METWLAQERERGYSARTPAGCCWAWSGPRSDGTLVPPLWATEDGGFGQVGCVSTAQGFEHDWSGVILGPDLVWRDGRVAGNHPENKDPDVRSTTKVGDDEFDRLCAPSGAHHLQGADDPRHGRHGPVLDRLRAPGGVAVAGESA